MIHLSHCRASRTPQITVAASVLPGSALRAKPRMTTRMPSLSNQAMQRRLLQVELAANQPGDAYEREAERVAEAVTRMSDPARAYASAPVARTTFRPGLQRACTCGGTCKDCQENAAIAQRATAANAAQAGTAPPIVHQVLQSPGQPLDAASREFMEPRFGADFGAVRVHTDSQAAESARRVDALAYTVGSHVVFGAGQYAPRTQAGQKLLAHEITHVLQQEGSSGGNSGLQRQPDGGGSATGPTVFACVKDLETSPIGRHTFFRVGSDQSGSPTYSLEPQDNRPLNSVDGEKFHSGCWQGVPMRDVPEDKNSTDSQCIPTTMSLSCLENQFSSYPIGKYCTLGPNSNTFVGFVAKQCGMLALVFSGWTPGIDVNPPAPGTFAPSPFNTLVGCFEESGCLAVATSDGGDTGGASGSSANDGQLSA